MNQPRDKSQVFTVSQLNESVRDLLELSFPSIWVEGEISNLSQPSSGHWYFTLKDEGGQVSAAMFRGNNRNVRFRLQNGQKVLARGRLSLYVPRGGYQLIVDQLEEAGLGALQRAFEALRARLLADGLFAPERKKALPEHPQHLAVITSPTGAAIRDILSVLKRRYPGLPVTIIPVPVQGAEAAPAIVRALDLANRAGRFDVILLARGGGSLEDLWAFNEEIVARAIARSQLPVISGVGHEVDFTIADFVADVRAPTPSAAAELISPNGEELAASFAGYEILLSRAMHKRLQWQGQQLQHWRARLKHPGRQVQELQQRVDDWEQRLRRAWQQSLQQRQRGLLQQQQRLQLQNPARRLQVLRQRLQSLDARQGQLITLALRQAQQKLAQLSQRAQVASPLATLARGYAIVEHDGRVIRDTTELNIGDRIQARLGQGRLQARVEAIQPEPPVTPAP